MSRDIIFTICISIDAKGVLFLNAIIGHGQAANGNTTAMNENITSQIGANAQHTIGIIWVGN